MLTYKLQSRHIKLESDEKLHFPGVVTISGKLSPPAIFGAGNEPSRLFVHGSNAKGLWNANTGRMLWTSDPPLDQLESIVHNGVNFSLKGNEFSLKQTCKDLEQLNGMLEMFHFFFPAYLNLLFPDPPTIDYIRGSLGKATFRWEHRELIQGFIPQTANVLEKHVCNYFETVQKIAGRNDRRTLAAINYFYTGSRLLVAGQSQWEFMAEAILNFSKVLEILFGSTRDDVREGLRTIGYERTEIEGDFVPMLVLRSKLDVAHPRTAIFDLRGLQTIYRYLSKSELRFREMLNKTIAAVECGQFRPRPIATLQLNKDDQKEFDRLILELTERNPTAVPG
jgi:hypothetical protein